MKALSIRQPWAYCITNGPKRVENRTWYASYRGPLLIHAGKSLDAGAQTGIYFPEMNAAEMLAAPRGAIVAVCVLIDCVRPHFVAADQRVWAGGPWCLVLEQVKAFATPIPCKGALGFFDVPLAFDEGERDA